MDLLSSNLDPTVVGRYIEVLRAERDRRLSGSTNVRWEKYREDPAGFIENVLGYHLWSKQREICRALVEKNRVAVPSCHESGKSFISGCIVPWWIAVHPPKEAMVVTTAPTFSQVETILWKEINRNHARGKLPGYMNRTEWVIDKETVAFGRKPDDHSPAAFQGIHARHLLVVVDEAGGVVGPLWDAFESLVANEGGKILIIGNPDDPQVEFARLCRPGSGYHVIPISAFDTPNLTGEEVPDDLKVRLVSRQWVEERKARWGESSPVYLSKVLGQFPDVSFDSLVRPQWVYEAVAREIETVQSDANELGVDVARSEGGNETVIYHRHGPRFRLFWAFRTRDTMRIVNEIQRAVRETGAKVVKIDDIGVGGGVVDRSKQIARKSVYEDPDNCLRGVQIIGVNVGLPAISRARDRKEKLQPKDKFFNLKAQLSWDLRERFRLGEIDLDSDEDTQAQACEVRLDTGANTRGRMKIESKSDMSERLAKHGGMTAESGSPDRWDALVLANAELEDRAPIIVSDEALRRARMPAMSGASGRYGIG